MVNYLTSKRRRGQPYRREESRNSEEYERYGGRTNGRAFRLYKAR